MKIENVESKGRYMERSLQRLKSDKDLKLSQKWKDQYRNDMMPTDKH
jgi:hypothetical protein